MSYFGHILIVRKSTPFLTEGEMDMEKIIRKKLIFIVVLIILISNFIFFALQFNNALNVQADMQAGTFVNVDELVLDDYGSRSDNNVFNGNMLAQLYQALTGKKGATYKDVLALGTQNASYFRSADVNNGKDIKVNLGGYEWTAAHLTMDRSGANLILTLWYVDTPDTVRYQTWVSNDSTIKYPSSMYSSSYVRAFGLNGGNSKTKGYAATAGTNTLTGYTQ